MWDQRQVSAGAGPLMGCGVWGGRRRDQPGPAGAGLALAGWSWCGLRRLPWLCWRAPAGGVQGGVDTAGENGGQAAGAQVAGVVLPGGSGGPGDAVTFGLLVPVSEAGLPELAGGARVHGGLLLRSCGQLRPAVTMRFRDEGWKVVARLLKPRPGGRADPLQRMVGQRPGGSGFAWHGAARRPA